MQGVRGSGRRLSTLWVIAMLAATGLAETAQAQEGSAAAILAEVEQRMLAAVPLIVDYTVRSDGAFVAELRGDLRLGDDQGGVRAQGFFGDDAYLLNLDFADGRIQGGNGLQGFDEAETEAKRALVIGLTRMGILHNLARLVSGAAPDHMNGGVEEWVQAVDVDFAEGDPDGAGPITLGLTFGILVGGVPSGEATLWLDERALPRLRMQTVRFPEGSMEVFEEYRFQTAPGL